MNTVLLKKNVNRLPEGFITRGAHFEDVERSCRLINRWTQSVWAWEENENSEVILREWKSPGFDPARDIRLVFAPNGDLAGYIEVSATFKPAVHPGIWGRVDPDYEGLGIGSWMLQWAEGHVLNTSAHTSCRMPDLPREHGVPRPAEKVEEAV